jgi:hypothetical protein
VNLRRVALACFVFGATVGTALDGIHTHSHTTAYPNPIFWMMAWWTPPVFGTAALGTGIAYPLVERLTRRRVAIARTQRDAMTAFAAFVILYFVSGYLRAGNPVKLAVLAIGAVYLWARFARTREAAALALVAALVGPFVEIVLVSFGAFRHLQPDVLGIPMWLPALYAAGSIALGLFGLSLLSSDARSLP